MNVAYEVRLIAALQRAGITLPRLEGVSTPAQRAARVRDPILRCGLAHVVMIGTGISTTYAEAFLAAFGEPLGTQLSLALQRRPQVTQEL